jgi:hypothetical protein
MFVTARLALKTRASGWRNACFLPMRLTTRVIGERYERNRAQANPWHVFPKRLYALFFMATATAEPA